MAGRRRGAANDAGRGTAPASFVRLLQFVLLPDILGASAGQVLYLAAKRVSRDLGSSIQDLKAWFAYMSSATSRSSSTRRRCSSSSALPHLPSPAGPGTPLCDLERGLIDGVLERITGGEVVTKETLCWGLGDTVCQFEAFTADHGGYLYPEEGRHVEVQRRLLAALADQSEIALENLRCVTERQTPRRATRSPTCYNFRHLREHAAVELARARRYKRQVAFVMLDLDDFEAVNERVGRDGGRRGAQALGRGALAARCAAATLCCRYGADEFLLVLPETADHQADQALERILRGHAASCAVEVDGATSP